MGLESEYAQGVDRNPKKVAAYKTLNNYKVPVKKLVVQATASIASEGVGFSLTLSR